MKHHLTERQTKVMVALYREQAFRRAMGCSVSSLVERRCLLDSRYAGPLAGLEEAGLVESHRDRVQLRPPQLEPLVAHVERARGRRGPERPLRAERSTGAQPCGCSRWTGLWRRRSTSRAAWTRKPGPWWTCWQWPRASGRLEIHSQEWRRGLGLLVLEGLLAGEVRAGSRNFLELLGPGDLVRPWTYRPEFAPSLAAPAKWDVLTTCPLCRSGPGGHPPAGPVAGDHRGAAGPDGRALTLAGRPVRTCARRAGSRSECGSRSGTSPAAGARPTGSEWSSASGR